MKKFVMSGLVCLALLIFSLAAAASQQPNTFVNSNPLLMSMDAPSAPVDVSSSTTMLDGTSVDITSPCTDTYQITNLFCNGNVRHYDQCVQTMSGGVWNSYSENCAASLKICSSGQCVTPSTGTPDTNTGNTSTNSNTKYLIYAGIGVVAYLVLFKKN